METTMATAHATLRTVEMVISVLLLTCMAKLNTRFSEGRHIAIAPNRQSCVSGHDVLHREGFVFNRN
jgi:hypothetical protein